MKKRSFEIVLPLLMLLFSFLVSEVQAGPAPAMPLQKGVEAAQEALENEGIEADAYFFYSVTLQNDSGGEYWKCTFRPLEGGRGGYGQITVKVYMNGRVEVVQPEVPVRYRR